MTNFTLGTGSDNRDVLKNGKLYFRSPIANSCHGSLRIGLMMPDEKAIDPKRWSNNDCEVVVAGGSCCHGHLMGLSERGIQKILELDFNICRIIPLICQESSFCFLVSGAGCSGQGVRVVDFGHHGKTPIVVPIFSTEECRSKGLYELWFHLDPLTGIPEIWHRLEAKGFTTDRDRTLQIQTLFKRFGGR